MDIETVYVVLIDESLCGVFTSQSAAHHALGRDDILFPGKGTFEIAEYLSSGEYLRIIRTELNEVNAWIS